MLKPNCFEKPSVDIGELIAMSANDPCSLLPVLRVAMYQALAGQTTQAIRMDGRELTFHAPAPEQMRKVIASLEHQCAGGGGARALAFGPRKRPVFSHYGRRGY